jgi:hypothetical protein
MMPTAALERQPERTACNAHPALEYYSPWLHLNLKIHTARCAGSAEPKSQTHQAAVGGARVAGRRECLSQSGHGG